MLDKYTMFWNNVPAELDPRLHDFGSRYIPTNDNWCGTHENGTVRGRVLVLSSGEIRVCFWGTDDTGMELDMPMSIEAYLFWNRWLTNLAYVSMDMLTMLGFKFA